MPRETSFGRGASRVFELAGTSASQPTKAATMNKKLFALLSLFLLFSAPARAQEPGSVAGTVTSQGAPVGSAQVIIASMAGLATYGGITDANGRFEVSGLPPGSYTVEVQMLGLSAPAREVSVSAGQTTRADIDMAPAAVALAGISVFAERAEARRTPVAFTDIGKTRIVGQLGSRDLPLVLNVTPSVYSTAQGGGAGDARVNVRGFSQRNTAVMINGVPVNDMENGWVYWSNWDGLGDAATSIQLQRGLSSVNLATPSIGGTINVITDPSAQDAGYLLKQEFGSGRFLKTTLTASTGPIGDFSLTASGVKKQGEGLIDGTWTDAWSYYLATRYHLNERNRLEFYAVGAPQRHGQNLYKLNAATLDRDFASSLEGYDPKALEKFSREAGRYWNPNLGGVSSNYTGRQYTSTGPGSGVSSRFDRSYLNERENYFHKPQLNLNWFSELGSGYTLNTVAYYSGGNGGGTGTYGSLVWNYDYTQRHPDWDATIARNASSEDGASRGILRNSVNNQYTIGGIVKLHKEFSESFTSQLGLDWRTAEIEHYREVRDLLGGTFYNDCFRGCSSEFWTEAQGNRGLGDKINYDSENTVDWLGVHLQGEHSNQNGSVYGMVGASMIGYTYTDYFRRGSGGGPMMIESGNLYGLQVKGGAMRNVSLSTSLYANAGWVSKVPIFDGVIDDNSGALNADPMNETFLSFEAGSRYRSLDRQLSFDANFYFTQWNDRTRVQRVRVADSEGTDGLINLLGVNARHMGVELEGAAQPRGMPFRLDAALSFGDWKHTNDPSGTYRPDDRQSETVDYTFYLDGVYVGDAPQFQVAYGLTFFPSGGLEIQAVGKTFGKHYANYDPFSRTDAADAGIQSWRPPGYTVFDLHASYQLDSEVSSALGGDVRLFLHMYNMFDAIYIQDATDNSRFNGFDGDHDADDAEVFLGIPRSFNLGFQIFH